MRLHIPTSVLDVLADTAEAAGVAEPVVWQTAADQFASLDLETRRRLIAECVATVMGPREPVEWVCMAMPQHAAMTALWVLSEIGSEDRLELVVSASRRG